MAIHMEKRPYVCSVCQRGFAYPSELKSHMEKHDKTKENTCNTCGESYSSPKKLNQHEQVSSNHNILIGMVVKTGMNAI